MSQTIHTGVIGLGGFAKVHHRLVQASSRAELVATCDPFPEHFSSFLAELDVPSRGIPVYTDYRDMLDQHELDLVMVPTPISLHAEMHAACVERGFPCYLEKPPTLDPAELASMIQTDARAAKATQVAFQQMACPLRRSLKADLVAGRFGALQRVSFAGHWPRGTKYFSRNNWAGTLMNGERLVLDSCIGNALAHFLNNLLFWAGDSELNRWATVSDVSAEMYRVHDIEGPDTVFARSVTRAGVPVDLAITHAGSGESWHAEYVQCEHATIEYSDSVKAEIHWADGRTESVDLKNSMLHARCLDSYLEYLLEEQGAPLMSLEQTKPFVDFHGLMYVAAQRIHTVPETYLEVSGTDDDRYTEIRGVVDVLRSFLADGRLPSEAGVPWSEPGGCAGVADVSALRDTVTGMQSERTAGIQA